MGFIPDSENQEKRRGFIPDRVSNTEELAKTKEHQAGIPQGSARATGLGMATPFLGPASPLVDYFLRNQAPEVSEAIQAAAEGGLSTVTGGMSEAAAVKAGVPLNDPESPRFRQPEAFSVGEIGAVALPSANLGRGTTVLGTIGRGAGTGAFYGELGGASKKIVEDPNLSLTEALLQSTPDAIIGGTVGAAIPAAVPIISKSSKLIRESPDIIKKTVSGLKRTPTTGMSNFLKVSGERGQSLFTELAESGKGDTILNEVAKEGKPKNYPELFKATGSAQKRLGIQVDDFIKENGKSYNVKTSTPDEIAKKLSDETLLTPEQISTVTEKMSEQGIGGIMPLEDAFAAQMKINSRYQNILKNSGYNFDVAAQNPLFQAYDIARRQISYQIDDIVKAKTGIEDNFYRNHGLVSQAEDLAQSRYNELFTKRNKEIEGGVFKSLKNVDITRPQTFIGKPVEFLRGGELGAANRSIESAFGKFEGKKISPTSPKKIGDVQKTQGMLKLQKLSDELEAQKAAGEAQRKAGAATPQELSEGGEATQAMSQMEKEYQSRITAENLRKQAEGEFEGLTKQSQKTIRKQDTGELLSDFYHNLNQGVDASRFANELKRRAGDATFRGEWPEIDDALAEFGIITPVR